MMILTNIAVMVSLILAMIPLSYAQVDFPEKELLVVNGAQDVQEYQTSDKRRLQITYSVILDYPLLAMNELQWNALKRRGWIQCSDKNLEKQGSEWIAFLENHKGVEHKVHRYMSFWSNKNRLITIAMSYYSTVSKGQRESIKSNNNQQVIILFDDFDSVYLADFVKNRLSLSCDK